MYFLQIQDLNKLTTWTIKINILIQIVTPIRAYSQVKIHNMTGLMGLF